MDTKIERILMGIGLCLFPLAVHAGYLHVSPTGLDTRPGTNWATAKATIQAAVDAAAAGDIVLVAPATYTPTATINISKRVTVMSADRPETTIVDGAQVRRCFNMNHSNAVLRGFTITRGQSTDGAGVWMQGGLLENCILVSNRVTGVDHPRGAGVFAYDATIRGCIFYGNYVLSTSGSGAGTGGGMRAERCYVENCLFYRNTLEVRNWDTVGGGLAAWYSKVLNCTMASNTIVSGGYRIGSGYYAAAGETYNCIIWGNTGSANCATQLAAVTSHCCTTPILSGDGQLSSDPKFVGGDSWRLQASSPCVNTGSIHHRTTQDLDGKDRDPLTPDMGCYELASDANLVTAGFGLTSPPQLTILSVSNRYRSNIVDIYYRVTDPDSPRVEVRGYAVAAPAAGPEWKYTDKVYPISTLVEGTAADFGSGLAPSNASRHLAWDAGADIGASVSGLRIELLGNDSTNLPISLNFVTVPTNTGGTEFKISTLAGATSDFQLRRALLWALCKGIAQRDNEGRLLAVGGTYNGQTVAYYGIPTDAGKLWLCEKIGGVRLATPSEIQRAREGLTPGTVIKWPSYYRWETKVNQLGIDTTDDNPWFFVME